MCLQATHSRGISDAFNLEDWTVEPLRNRVTKGEVSKRLEPKAMEVLLCLAEHPGEVVTRQALFDRVWATEFISDSTLTHTVADIRKALGDNARVPRYIETIPKRGYRLVAAPEALESPKRSSDRRPLGVCEPLAVIMGERVRLGSRAGSGSCGHFLFFGDQEIPLLGSPIVFGRGQEADIQVLVPEVSRHHARMDVAAGETTIEDLGSKNGTLVNGSSIHCPHRLDSGDTVDIGPTSMIYRWLSDERTQTQQDL